MALTDPTPMPPDLALDPEPFGEDDLARTLDAVRALADEAAIDVESVLADAAASEEGDPAWPEPVRRWHIGSEGEAEWAMRHLAAVRDEQAVVRSQAVEWLDRIQRWLVERSRPLDARAAFFAAHLERYALDVREASGGKAKTLKLPSGVVKTTEHAPKIAVEDSDALVAWIEENLEPEEVERAIRVTKKPLVSELRRESLVLVELPTSVVVSPCGCIESPRSGFSSIAEVAAWTVGSAVTCPGCGEDGLVGRWAKTFLAVRDEAGRPVPGAFAEAGTITAKAVAT